MELLETYTVIADMPEYSYCGVMPKAPVHTRFVTHADYKALEKRLTEGDREFLAMETKYLEARTEIEHLAAELAECRKDAERLRIALRWIVDRPSTVSEVIAQNALDGNEYPPKRKAIARGFKA